MTADDLAAWLLEQIYTDRVLAEDAARDWVDGEDGDEMAGQTDSILVGSHLVRWSPARVLAECDAKRRIIEHHGVDTLPDGEPAGKVPRCETCDNWAWPCPTLRFMSLPYADRPGYREEWKP